MINTELNQEIIKSLNLYVTHGIQPGHFLTAVLENDLSEAMKRADVENRGQLFLICRYIYNVLPGDCHGSKEAVKNYLERVQA